MNELEYCNHIILVEIEKIQESLIDLSNAHKIILQKTLRDN